MSLSANGARSLHQRLNCRRGGQRIRVAAGTVIYCAAAALFPAMIGLRADQVEMQNGDRYLGKVLSLDTNTLVLRSDVLGTVRLPRGKVALITLGLSTSTNLARLRSATNGLPDASSVTLTNGITDLSASLRQLGANTNFIQQVQAQILGARK